MRTIKEIIKNQVDYTILQIMLDILQQQQQITEDEWKRASQELKEQLNPPTRMLEDYNE